VLNSGIGQLKTYSCVVGNIGAQRNLQRNWLIIAMRNLVPVDKTVQTVYWQSL